MKLAKYAAYSRKIHRFCVFLVVILGAVMMTTGSVMKYPDLLIFIDPSAARRVHSFTSAFFSIVLFVMMSSGLFMYLYPQLQKFIRKPSSSGSSS